MKEVDRLGFKDKVIYQVYPKSFYDSNNDGVGDIRGIIEKIPYIAKLNVDMVWFNPFFVSPQKDNGYDIADYRNIDPQLGTMEDFEELVMKLKEKGIEVMLDMVLNHTSVEHEWFQKALNGDKKYQDYYILREAHPDGRPPTNWESKFGGSAWGRFDDKNHYYLHLYDGSQADLNWRNPEVRKELYAIVNFWMDKGVKGFRFDVINVIGKDEELVDAPTHIDSKYLYTDQPIVHKYLRELNQETFGNIPDAITVGEMSSTTIENSIKYANPSNDELTMVFSFHHLKVDYDNGEKWTKNPFDFMKLKHILNEWQEGMEKGQSWNALFWNNHDQPRALNRFGDPGDYRVKSAKMLATTIHLLRGTPYIYMGEEIGMIDPDYHSMSDYEDVEAINAYHRLVNEHKTETEAFKIVQSKARDNSRMPMLWSDQKYAGFSNSKPWLRPTHYDEINVERELNEGSLFRYYQKLIQLRKTFKVISVGGYESILLDHPNVFAYLRTYEDHILIVINNFFKKETEVVMPDNYIDLRYQVLITNGDRQVFEKRMLLQPYETIAFLFN